MIFLEQKEEYEGFEFLGAMYVEKPIAMILEKEALFALEQKKLHNLFALFSGFKI